MASELAGFVLDDGHHHMIRKFLLHNRYSRSQSSEQRYQVHLRVLLEATVFFAAFWLRPNFWTLLESIVDFPKVENPVYTIEDVVEKFSEGRRDYLRKKHGFDSPGNQMAADIEHARLALLDQRPNKALPTTPHALLADKFIRSKLFPGEVPVGRTWQELMHSWPLKLSEVLNAEKARLTVSADKAASANANTAPSADAIFVSSGNPAITSFGNSTNAPSIDGNNHSVKLENPSRGARTNTPYAMANKALYGNFNYVNAKNSAPPNNGIIGPYENVSNAPGMDGTNGGPNNAASDLFGGTTNYHTINTTQGNMLNHLRGNASNVRHGNRTYGGYHRTYSMPPNPNGNMASFYAFGAAHGQGTSAPHGNANNAPSRGGMDAPSSSEIHSSSGNGRNASSSTGMDALVGNKGEDLQIMHVFNKRKAPREVQKEQPSRVKRRIVRTPEQRHNDPENASMGSNNMALVKRESSEPGSSSGNNNRETAAIPLSPDQDSTAIRLANQEATIKTLQEELRQMQETVKASTEAREASRNDAILNSIREQMNSFRLEYAPAAAPRSNTIEIALPVGSEHLEYLKCRDAKQFLGGVDDEIGKVRSVLVAKIKAQGDTDESLAKAQYLYNVVHYLEVAMEQAKKGVREL
ncbi:uncharacterized protein BCR38DRAFT_430661 [Pseudomassariella vexata]|uniref:Uncharacterized protein n=1 Tax=Pseudomassariella vexata TaxID=1141098 RepID=A0A1Y2E4U2_9PEZI|nr:uncharacterized protein BCR38DRAFT_430661 [Pseudomassariella vexata]ORY66571.1 hypothetical protein BCR38DRAFT_430661 [Pseudomassariella vexata]